jgi:thiamine biosynthesis lipoprotein
MARKRRGLAPLLLLACLTLSASCSPEDADRAGELEPVEIEDQAGAVCGMLVRDQSAPRAQVIHRDGERAFLCSIGDLLIYLEAPSPHGAPSQVLVEAMDPSEDPSESHTGPHPWVPAELGVYVVGIERRGIMGAPVLVYRSQESAQRVALGTSARILDFEELKRWWSRRQSAAPAHFVLSDRAMGTTWSVVLNPTDPASADPQRARAVIDARLAETDRLMSTWRQDSELSRFNRHASTDAFPLSPKTFEVLRIAQGVSEASDGAFDVTVGPLVAVWGFGAQARSPRRSPDPAELAGVLARVGFRLLRLDSTHTAAHKQRPDVECDLSAIAKGFAVDEIARALTEIGWSDFLVELGGEVRARGRRPGGTAWQVGIERPDPAGRLVHAVLALDDQALATSGDYRNFYWDGDQRRTHILDPRTGRPLEHQLTSVSVVHREAALADAWATALIVLGPEQGFARARAEGLGAYFIVRTGDDTFASRATPAFPAVDLPG